MGAEETCVGALRSLYMAAGKELHREVTGAATLEKPGRLTGRRRALHDFELVELYEVTAGGGKDPDLDELLFDFGLQSGARREGIYKATVGALHAREQLVTVCDKYLPLTLPRRAPRTVTIAPFDERRYENRRTGDR